MCIWEKQISDPNSKAKNIHSSKGCDIYNYSNVDHLFGNKDTDNKINIEKLVSKQEHNQKIDLI